MFKVLRNTFVENYQTKKEINVFSILGKHCYQCEGTVQNSANL